MTIASIIRLVLLGAIWGSSFLFMRIAAPAFGPPTLIGIRLVLAALFLACVALATKQALPVRANWRQYFVIGATNSAAPFLLFAYAALHLPASLLSLFNSLAPLCGAVVAALWLKTPITARVGIGLFLGVAGVGVLSYEHLAAARIAGEETTLALSFAAALGAPLLYGVAATYIKKTAFAGKPFDNAHGSMWAASILAAPFAATFAPATTPAAPIWGAALALGLLCTGIAYLLQFKLIADLGPTRALTVAFLIPVFGVLWGVWLLGEPVTLHLLAGGALIVLGMYLTIVQPTAVAAKVGTTPGGR
jgi:drug/metabolite transporter (DMT)-like permease